MHLEISQVSVKAKTAEGILGELGTAEAVMAQAVVLISQNPC
jgi:2-C-methyl-D-erythritol 2,4-cyclodiphosphate synthase